MGISLYTQTTVLLYSVCIGVTIGALYDVFRILRICVRTGKGLQFVYDILFSLIVTAVFVLFLFHANDGQIRWFSVCGAIIGFTAYYNTAGRIVMIFAEFIVTVIKKVLRFVIGIVTLPFRLIGKIAGKYILVQLLKIKRIIKNILNHFIYLSKRYKIYRIASKCFGLDK